SQALPPITEDSLTAGGASASVADPRSGCSRATPQALPVATMRNPTAISSIDGAPSASVSVTASQEPKIAPLVPPTAMAPDGRLLCSSEKRSAMRAQNAVVMNWLKTLIQT